nr:uncharacterized protein LOC110369699 [Helicoverpa armigera]
MATEPSLGVKVGMFLFEVVVENVKSMVESRILVIKSDFANIFSLELKDPKQMHIVMPEPLPLPPEPPGKKGKKKKAKPKKPKKGKKGKKGAKVEEPPPEPAIQSGQSVLFSSSPSILIQNMKKCPLELSLWSKEENLVFIGNTSIPWDPVFLLYLEKIADCQEPPPVVVKDEYNIFEEGRAKLMAKLSIQVKLSFLNDKVTTAFRTLSEDPTFRKCLYTGINSKTTSYMCTLKTTDEAFEENCNKIENQFIVDKPKSTKIAFADYKNAPGANLAFFGEDGYCCMNHADKPPESIYKAPETCPDIDFIIDYVRKIIVSCNDNMRMLTPRPTISPRVKATDIDRLCYCRETAWPKGEFAERFKKEAKMGPCPLCMDAGVKTAGTSGPATFDIANIRGPCGKPECKIARDIRAYIENLVDEDNEEFMLDDLIGPCGSKNCTLTARIQDFLQHEGVFAHGATLEGMSTQCACVDKMKEALTKRTSCASICSKDCEDASSDSKICEGKGCPHKKPEQKVYDVYYFTVQYEFENKPDTSPSGSESDRKSSGKEPDVKSNKSDKSEKPPSKYKYCGPECPSVKASDTKTSCSKTNCSTDASKLHDDDSSKCVSPVCPSRHEYDPSPADSNIEMRFDELYNPCCVKSCDVVDRVKDFIADGVKRKAICPRPPDEEDPCYCDCVCTFKFSSKTTYCAVCGGYECLGDDMRDQPEYIKPHPCPVYHKLYDKKYIDVQSPWPEDEANEGSTKTGRNVATRRSGSTKGGKGPVDKKSSPEKKAPEKKDSGEDKTKKSKKTDNAESKDNSKKKKKKDSAEAEPKKTNSEKKKVGKFTASADNAQAAAPGKKDDSKPSYHYPPVPPHMGWRWNAEDIPGMKFRPNWRPGAANAVLVRRYRTTREGTDSINKKKRALLQRKKKIEMKPTLIVTKHDGEYTVQMEVFKKFSKERLLFQYPYDEKPPLIYTIGKTAEEKRKIQRQRDRRERRETRRKSRLLQSTFRDRCQEICLKAYNQAIGLLPLPHPNAPDCPCAESNGSLTPPIIDSCSCSDVGTISSSDTDNDEWIVEFTPPAARWDAKAKHPPVYASNETQYNYLDYKVKVLDKSGNQVPRFFKGPDGKQECSDLGGFWSPKKTWLEINKDGYIGPDERWVPMNFIGPDGLYYSAEEGSFTDNSGQLWKIGIDGYIDKDGNWAWYNNNNKKKTVKGTKSKSSVTASTVDVKKGGKSTDATSKGKESKNKGDTAPAAPHAPAKSKSKLGDRKKSVVPAVSTSPISKTQKNDKDKAKKTHPIVPNHKSKTPLVMSVSVNYDKSKLPRLPQMDRKAYMDAKKIAKYREIIEELRAYDDLGELKLPRKTNRASNTPRKKLSPFTMQGFIDYERKMQSLTDRSFGLRTSTISSTFESKYQM